VALLVARPSLWWVSCGCASLCAYAVWGLADRALDQGDATGKSLRRGALRALRVVAAAAGIASAIGAAVGLLGMMIGRAGPPG
jgi:hypothetical protein